MSLEWTVLDRLALAADLPAISRKLLRASEAERVALAGDVEAGIKATRFADWIDTAQDPAPGHALAVIGCMPSAARAAALLTRRDMRNWETFQAPRFLEIARARDLPWLGDLAIRLAAQLRPQDAWTEEWGFVDTLLRATGALPPVTEGVVRGWLAAMYATGGRPRASLAARLRTSRYLDLLLPAVFEFDGIGSLLTQGDWSDDGWDPTPAFPAAVAELVVEGRLDRGEVLAATMDRLVRGDRPAWLRPFALLHDALDPTADELAVHATDYARLLPDAPSAVAGLAQRALRRLDETGRLELDTLLEASEPTLLRKEKTLVKTQLGWLDRVALRERSAAVLETAAAAFGHPALDVQERALNVIARHPALLDAPTSARLATLGTVLDGSLQARARALFGGGPGSAPPPASAPALPPPPPPAPMPAPIGSAVELAEEIVALLHAESAVGWERVLAGLVTLRHAGDDLAPLIPVMERYDHLADQYAEESLRCLGEAIRSVVAPHRRDGVWGRIWHAWRKHGPPTTLTGPPTGVLALRAAELAERLSTSPPPMLLATPTQVNGALDPRTLLDRLTVFEAAAVDPWPLDLDQALLRLPRDADAAVLAEAWALTSPAGRRFAEWLAKGGLPDPVSVRFDQRGGGTPSMWAFPQLERRVVVNLEPSRSDGLPLEKDLLTLTRRTRPTYYERERADLHRGDVLTMVLPHHREAVAAWALPSVAAAADEDAWGAAAILPLLADCAGPPGPAMSLALAYGLGARHEPDRAAAVDAFLTLAATPGPGAGSFSAALGADLGDLGADGTVKLTRVAPALTEALRAGASGAVWDVLAAALPLLLPAAPRGLPDLLMLAAQAADASGARGDLPGRADVASRRGSSRLVKEARRLREALTGAAPSAL
ncbi:MAG: DUF6493 family protein [Actinoplanes sp.]